MKTSATDIGKRIKALRKDQGLTQTEFGERIGVKGNTVTGYENGTRRPSDSVINYICLIFNVDQTWLRTGETDRMYLPEFDFSDAMEKVKFTYNCNDLEMSFLRAYFGLKEKERDAFCELLSKMFPEAVSAIAGDNALKRFYGDFEEAPPIESNEIGDEEDYADFARQQRISEKKRDVQASSVKESDAG